MMDDKNLGKKFSATYIDPGPLGSDSARLRIKISAYHSQNFGPISSHLVSDIPAKLGAEIPTRGAGLSFDQYYKSAELRDLLDTITLIWQILNSYEDKMRGTLSRPNIPFAASWVKFVNNIFDEENLHYFVDDLGGVHLKVDAEYKRNFDAAILVLSNSEKFNGVVELLTTSQSKLDSTPPDTKEAMRDIFEAVETLYKFITESDNKKDRLSERNINKKIKPIVNTKYKDNETALNSANHMVNSFIQWTEAGHYYRHGQKLETIVQAPLDYAILYVSSGISYLRWLAILNN